MATIKSFTSLEQSKKLAEILPLESADMFHFIDDIDKVGFGYRKITADYYSKTKIEYIPCWSLAALLNILPEYNLQRTDWGDKTEYKIVVTTDENNYASKNYDNPLDACVELILKLHELNLL
jgi:hypothetical protein